MKDIIFNPMVPFSIMLVVSIILALVVIINRKNIVNRLLIIILLFIISQRPMVPNTEEETFKYDLDVIFVVDTTLSMNAIDVNNNTRIKAVIDDCKYIIDEITNADYSLITFNNYSQIKVPLINDIEIISSVIDDIKVIDPTYATGSSLSLPYNNLEKVLNSSKTKNEHQRIVFFISDGEKNNNDSNNISIYSNIKNLIDNGAVLGYGSSNGAKIVVNNTINNSSFVDKQGFLLESNTSSTSAISKMDEQNLKEIANNLGLDYYHMINKSVISNKLNDIKKNALKSSGELEYSNTDLYSFFSFFLTILLIIELLYNRRNEQ